MGASRKFFRGVRRKFLGSSLPAFSVLDPNTTSNSASQSLELGLNEPESSEISSLLLDTTGVALCSLTQKKLATIEDIAAANIQAAFRGHLARRAFRALRSLVRLQALVRGVLVRRQVQMAYRCMHALARLQVTVRARQLLGGGQDSKMECCTTDNPKSSSE